MKKWCLWTRSYASESRLDDQLSRSVRPGHLSSSTLVKETLKQTEYYLAGKNVYPIMYKLKITMLQMAYSQLASSSDPDLSPASTGPRRISPSSSSLSSGR
jgi:hypothetical protein